MAHLLADMTIEAQLSLQPLLHLARHLSADLPAALRVTAGLRYSEAAGANVRAFAAQVCSSSVSWDRVRPTVT